MNTRLYSSLIAFTLSLIATGILVYLAIQNGLVIPWVAAACSGLTAFLCLRQIVYWLRQKPSPSSDSKERADRV